MDTAQFLRNDFDQIVAAVAAGVAEHVGGFNVGIEDPHHPLRRLRQRTLRLSLSGMADEIDARHGTAPGVPMDWSAHRELGRMECRSGRPLSEILQAPWAASRTIFHHCVQRADDAGLTPLDLQEIADVVIDWSDRISVAFSEGYDDESSARAGQIEARRQRLLELVLAGRPNPEAVAAAAREAGWRPPSQVRVLVTRGADRDRFRRRLPSGGLVAEIGDELCALLPEPVAPGELGATSLDPGTFAALGPPADLSDASVSAGLARRALDLARDGQFTDGELIDCSEHELTLLLFADAPLARRFSDRLLEPIAHRPELVRTLAAWLELDGRTKATAAGLGVHPHTVTYRLNRIRELLGPVVDDGRRRLELLLATRIQQAGDR